MITPSRAIVIGKYLLFFNHSVSAIAIMTNASRIKMKAVTLRIHLVREEIIQRDVSAKKTAIEKPAISENSFIPRQPDPRPITANMLPISPGFQ